jgi:hypothetical protein
MMSKNPIDTREAIAVAIAAYQLNGNEYLKDKEWEPGVGNIKRWENKEILRNYFSADYYSEGAISPPKVKITDEHYKIVDDIIQFSKKLLLKVLAADPNSTDYEVVLYQKMNQPTVTFGDFGYIASTPMYFYNATRKEDLKRRLEEDRSQHVGSLGGRVDLVNFEVTRNQWSNNFQGYVVMGFCDDNLFLFFTNKNIAHIKVGDRINLKGRIKDHILEKDQYPMTKLNYVQIEGLENAPEITTRTNNHSNLF